MSWPKVPLGEVLQQRKEFVTIDDDALYLRCRVQTSARGVVLRDKVVGADIKTKKQQVCRSGDFLVAEIDAKAGGYGIVPPELQGAVVSSHYFLFDVNSDIIYREYLSWYVRTKEFFSQVQAVGSTNYAAIRPADVLQYTVPLPPLAEQRRIVAKLDAVAALVSRARHGIMEIDEALLQTARNIIWRAGATLSAWMFCREFMHQRPMNIQVDADKEYKFAGVYSFGRGVFQSETKLGSAFKYTSLTRVRTDDFTYPKLMAWEGALGLVPPECDGLVVSPEFPVFEINAEIVLPAVVDVYFRDPRIVPMLRAASAGTNMRRRRIQPTRFLDLKMPVPLREQQILITELIKHRQLIQDRHRKNINDLDRLLPAMLDETFGTS